MTPGSVLYLCSPDLFNSSSQKCSLKGGKMQVSCFIKVVIRLCRIWLFCLHHLCPAASALVLQLLVDVVRGEVLQQLRWWWALGLQFCKVFRSCGSSWITVSGNNGKQQKRWRLSGIPLCVLCENVWAKWGQSLFFIVPVILKPYGLKTVPGSSQTLPLGVTPRITQEVLLFCRMHVWYLFHLSWKTCFLCGWFVWANPHD